jgi:hypothetical protein
MWRLEVWFHAAVFSPWEDFQAKKRKKLIRHCCVYTFGKVYFQVSRYRVSVEASAFKYSWGLDEDEIQKAYLI